MKRSIHIIAFGMVCLCGFKNLQAQDQSMWRSRGRIQIGTEYDSNIREDYDDPTESNSMRLMFQYSGAKKNYLRLSYRGGYQGYWKHSEENKLINDLSLSSTVRASKRICFGVETRGRLKIFLNAIYDYAAGHAHAFTDIPLARTWVARMAYGREMLDYEDTDTFDYSGWYVRGSINKQLSKLFSLTTSFSTRNLSYDRPAFGYDRVDEFWYTVDSEQKDNIYQFSVLCELKRYLICNFSYSLERNNSNSYGFSYMRHRLQVVCGTNLHKTTMLRLLATFQSKKYAEDLRPFIPLELDTEREQSNFIVADISYSIMKDLCAIVRIAWYNNESPLRSLYYDKFTASISFEQRL